MSRRLAAVVVACAVVAAACGGSPDASAPEVTPVPLGPGQIRLEAGEKTLAAEVADTPTSRQTGLMHRTEMARDAGMLFVFPTYTEAGFWMRNTLIPLSIAYLDTAPGGYRVLAILHMDPCPAEETNCPTYSPGVPYLAALEVNQGWFAEAGVQIGDTIAVQGPVPTAET